MPPPYFVGLTKFVIEKQTFLQLLNSWLSQLLLTPKSFDDLNFGSS